MRKLEAIAEVQAAMSVNCRYSFEKCVFTLWGSDLCHTSAYVSEETTSLRNRSKSF